MTTLLINFAYIFSALLFVLGLKKLSSPGTARKGNLISGLGMLIAIIAALLDQGIIDYSWIFTGILIGSILGIIAARKVAMTSMPEMVALLNGFGGISSLLVASAAYIDTPYLDLFPSITISLSILIGGVTFTGSLVAWGKLSEKISGKPLQFPGTRLLNSLLLGGVIASCTLFAIYPGNPDFFLILITLSLILGLMTVLPIGGGDMPVVIALLNSYSGLAACAAGFVIENNLLIVAGALVGASGIILTIIMCKAMNRSLSNVLFSGFGSGKQSKTSNIQGEAKAISSDDAFYVLEAARSAVIIPGYGLAVAQAQHVVKELVELLEANDCEVKFAIHPVAGRMPGHMNVLLAEADVPYDQLVEMDDINAIIDTVDICVVIGANDVVNPDAIESEGSPIYGMPIIEAHRAKSVFVLKRSMNTGFAGIQNPLFFKENTRMLFGDAKESIQSLITQFK